MDEFMAALGTHARITVARKLSELWYQTSYSHSGRYYALKSNCEFNEIGLWSCRKAWFSIYETLLETARAFVDKSDAGYSNGELDKMLHVQTRPTLIQLHKKGILTREKFGGVYVYLSANEQSKRRQSVIRSEDATGSVDEHLLAHELKAAIVLFFSLLDERQRRVFAGLESLKMGKGGDASVARILGIDSHTVARGRIELQERDVDIDRIRQKGGGRHTIKKKHQK